MEVERRKPLKTLALRERMENQKPNALASDLAFEGHNVRMVMLEGAQWWALSDVAKILGIANHKHFLSSPWCGKDGVRQTYLIDSLGRKQSTTVINEPNLYAIVLRSDKPEALAFHLWITQDVLPAIREKGFYAAPPASEYERMLAMFVPGYVRPWESAFPEEFFREVCRLNGWKFDPRTHKTPRRFGLLIRDVLYERLPSGVLAKLDEINPADPETGRRSKRHHQALAEEAVKVLKERIRHLTDMARVEGSWPDFKARVDAMYPKPGRQMTLPGSLSAVDNGSA
jgi:prophage antirepressor-like protein